MNQKLNWGIIGWGNISKTVANCFKDADFCQLGSIASKTKKYSVRNKQGHSKFRGTNHRTK